MYQLSGRTCGVLSSLTTERQFCIRAAAVKTRRLCLYQHLERFDVFHPHRHAFRYAVGPDLVCSLASRTLGIEEQQRSTSIAVSGPKPTAGLEASELSCARRDHVGQNLTISVMRSVSSLTSTITTCISTPHPGWRSLAIVSLPYGGRRGHEFADPL